MNTTDTLQPGPLPHTIDQQILNVGRVVQVYPKILEFEASAIEANDEHRIIYARILGYLILVDSRGTVRQAVAAELTRCRDQNMYADLGKRYCNFLHAFKRTCDSRPVTSEVSPWRRFGRMQQEVQPKLESCPTNHKAAKEAAMHRDGLRCVATGVYDLRVEKLQGPLEGRIQGKTECAHIIPSSLNTGVDSKDGTKKDYASAFWDTLGIFGHGHFQEELKGKNIHSLTNVMTLSEIAHTAFDALALWFEPTDRPNVYRVRVAKSVEVQLKLNRLKEEVEFTSPDPDKFPLPSPAALEIHAMCARVSQLSGAGEYIDRIQREVELTDVLAEDGSSAALLRSAIEVYCHQPLKMEGFPQY